MAKEVEQNKVADKPLVRVFIYTLSDPISGEVRYVGKAINIETRLQGHLRDHHINRKANWLKSLKEKGLRPRLEVLEEVIEADWADAEKFWIESLRFLGCRLTNELPGGDGGPTLKGIKFSPEHRQKISKALTGLKKSPAHIEKCRRSLTGKKRSVESRRKQSASIRSKPLPQSTKTILALGRLMASSKPARKKAVQSRWSHNGGAWHSSETKDKIRQAALRRFANENQPAISA